MSTRWFSCSALFAMVAIAVPAAAQSYGTRAYAVSSVEGVGQANDGTTFIQRGTTSASASADYAGNQFGSIPSTGSATGSATLADGSLRGYASTTGRGSASAQLGWQDVLTFQGLGARDPSGVTPITILYTFEGELTTGPGSVALGRGQLLIGGPFSEGTNAIDAYYRTDQHVTNEFTWGTQNPFISRELIQNGPSSWTIRAVWGLPNTYSGMFIGASLQSLAFGSATADFSGTSSVRLELPAGVTFTSASGQFLSAIAPAGAVPEPSTWAMMLIGFGAIGTAMRRGRRLSWTAQAT